MEEVVLIEDDRAIEHVRQGGQDLIVGIEREFGGERETCVVLKLRGEVTATVVGLLTGCVGFVRVEDGRRDGTGE